ncbi:HTH domain-containing protein [Paenactinomyces guangxiensis]|uniref:HTH domain-containing protein n=1 Tax=Paenactinomyces guangxiensis TaxID=1490290 RepID=A0A7W1WRJ1_9BACL|nr:HTH domain-containing protein [Paenactinomyces guangxiensis]MBH8591737.1 HTH domain-containing protein [Paenactinomyces guangxiensis]
MLDERKVRLLQFLLKTNQITSVNDLAKIHDVSEKTIRNDLNEIASWLKHAFKLQLVRRPGVEHGNRLRHCHSPREIGRCFLSPGRIWPQVGRNRLEQYGR